MVGGVPYIDVPKLEAKSASIAISSLELVSPANSLNLALLQSVHIDVDAICNRKKVSASATCPALESSQLAFVQ